MKKSLATIALLALALAGCSTGPSGASEGTMSATEQSGIAESTPTASSASQCNDPSCDPNVGLFPIGGKYAFTYPEGATGAFEFDSKPDPEIESLRKEVKASPVHYMNVKVDNRKGSEHAPVYQVVAFDTDGKKYTYVGIGDFLEEWQGEVDTDKPGMSALYNRFVDASNARMGSVDVSEVGTQLLAFEGVLPNEGFTRVEVQPSGMGDGVDAYIEGQEPPSNDYPDAFDGSMTVDQCMVELAEETASDEGITVAEVMDDPEYRELCETLVGP